MILLISIMLVFISSCFGQEFSPKINPNKFTVCAITINSDEEKKVFESQVKKYPNKFNPIVELTSFGDSDWFDKACASNIRCDQLVISGHFGGSFFGSSSKRLDLRELENKGCSKTCEGILSHPYESFLFGCNTLSTKEKDHRTPAQYLQVLLNDGIPQAEAELVVESRYGLVGDDHKSKMIRAFSGNLKQLYGFDSVGPSGKNVEGFLKNYFSKIDPVDHLEKLQAKRMMGKINFTNEVLASSLKNTAFTQCHAGATDKNGDIICKLRNNKLNVDQKLETVFDALSHENYLTFIPSINEFFKAHPVSSMTQKQKERVAELSKNTTIKSQVENLLNKTNSLTLMLEWTRFAENLGFINNEKRIENLNRILSKVFINPLTLDDKILICSINEEVKIKISPDPSVVKNRILNEMDIEALSCMRVQNKELQMKLVDSFKSLDSYGRRQLAGALGKIRPQGKDVQLHILEAAKNEIPSVRRAIGSSFGSILPKDVEVQLKLTQFLRDEDVSTRQQIASVFEDIKPQDKEVQLKILESINDKNSMVRKYIVYAIKNTNTQDKDVLLQLTKGLSDGSSDVREETIEALTKLKPQDKEVQLKILEAISLETEQNKRINLATLVRKLKPRNKEFQMQLIKSLAEERNFYDPPVQIELVEAFAEINPQDAEVQLKLIEAFQNHSSSLLTLFSSIPLKDSQVKEKLKKVVRKLNKNDDRKRLEQILKN